MSIAGFQGRPIKGLGKPFYTGLAQQELIASYVNSAGVTVKVFVGYFQSQNAEQELVDYRYNWLHEGAQTIDVADISSSVNMKMNTVRTETGPETAYFVYDINGRSLIDPKMVKLATLVDALFYRRTNGALIVVLFDKATDTLSAEEHEFLRQFLREVRARL
jgi:EpsI family protein